MGMPPAPNPAAEKPRLSIKTASKATLLDRTLSCAATPSDSDQFDTIGLSSIDIVSSRSSTPKQPRHSLKSFNSASTIDPSGTNMPYRRYLPLAHRSQTHSNQNALIETGVGIGIRDSGFDGLLEGQDSGKQKTILVHVSRNPEAYSIHCQPQSIPNTSTQQQLQTPLMEQQQYLQQGFYQDSPCQSNQFQEQPRVFYLQPATSRQFPFSEASDYSQTQAQMFTYSLAPQQQLLLSPHPCADGGGLDTQNCFSLSTNGMDGCFTPPGSADLSVMSNNGIFPTSAPSMTISPSSLQHVPSELHQSPTSCASEVTTYVNPQFHQDMDVPIVRKRRLSEELKEHGNLTTVSSAGIEQDGGRSICKVSAKKLRKDNDSETNLLGNVKAASTSPSDILMATTSSKGFEGSMSDGQSNHSLPLRRHLAVGKKKNPPPGGFKPWNTSPASSHLPSGSECINPITGEVSLPNLENLTKEEIRKVKNRASAQRSRTRKSEQTYELRLENAKLIERMELIKQALKEARPDLCQSLSLDKPEPSLLSYDNGLAVRCEGMYTEDEERRHMQMLIQGLRTQLDSERNQRALAEQKVSRLQRELDSHSPISTQSSSPSIATVSPPSCPVSPKLTLDQVAERENAIRIVRMASDLDDADMDDETLCSVPASPTFHAAGSTGAPLQYVAQTDIGRQVVVSGAPLAVKREEQELGSIKLESSSMRDEKGALMFVMLVSMALFALPAANRSSQFRAPCPASKDHDPNSSSTAESTGILHSIQHSILPGGSSKQNVSVTLLKPLIGAEDLAGSCMRTQSIQQAKSENELNQAFQDWLGQSTIAVAEQETSAAPRGWIVVKSKPLNTKDLASSTASPEFWQGSESESHLDLFNMIQDHDSIARAPMSADCAFPALFTPDSALWNKGPSPTLAPLIVEDPFADIDCASELVDLQHRTRASTVFDDQSSSFMSSRRTSIHSHWHHDDMAMTRSVSAMPTINAISSFEKSTAIKFAKIDLDIEIQTSIVFKAARCSSDSSSTLDRTEAGRLLTSGASYPQ
ncbi:hypothetical protein QFC19_002578 [Naganishia cerealis]|uniref:Uncharacterized protein n=1 Tax=Naganishia cerealis TaxID=610337 RepID=A0ACC2W8P1_9TREE|nr:hypothetical protein QFC19_002578 [Naganishia cerealis]